MTGLDNVARAACALCGSGWHCDPPTDEDNPDIRAETLVAYHLTCDGGQARAFVCPVCVGWGRWKPITRCLLALDPEARCARIAAHLLGDPDAF